MRIFLLMLSLLSAITLTAQKSLPQIKAGSVDAFIQDGENVKISWKLDPAVKPDIYYVNIPHKRSRISFKTDREQIDYTTEYGKSFDFVVLLNNRDSCFVRILAKEDPSSLSAQSKTNYPVSIPFTMKGSRVYFDGRLNDGKSVSIQLDLGAGSSAINKLSADKLNLVFEGKAILSNTQGVNDVRLSQQNTLSIGDLSWTKVPFVEVGNMQPHEDLIIGNSLFRDRIIEINYDKKQFILHKVLPAYAKQYLKQPVFFEQHRPMFKIDFLQNGNVFTHWFEFDTGRDGTMLIGEDFTAADDNWNRLKELQIINGRKIVRLDATIAGKTFKDIVTNAADPAKPAGRHSLFGNALLNKFNVILDNINGFIYLKPNTHIAEPYADYEKYLQDISKQKN